MDEISRSDAARLRAFELDAADAVRLAREAIPDYPYSSEPTASEAMWAATSSAEGARLACNDWAKLVLRLVEAVRSTSVEPAVRLVLAEDLGRGTAGLVLAGDVQFSETCRMRHNAAALAAMPRTQAGERLYPGLEVYIVMQGEAHKLRVQYVDHEGGVILFKAKANYGGFEGRDCFLTREEAEASIEGGEA